MKNLLKAVYLSLFSIVGLSAMDLPQDTVQARYQSLLTDKIVKITREDIADKKTCMYLANNKNVENVTIHIPFSTNFQNCFEDNSSHHNLMLNFQNLIYYGLQDKSQLKTLTFIDTLNVDILFCTPSFKYSPYLEQPENRKTYTFLTIGDNPPADFLGLPHLRFFANLEELELVDSAIKSPSTPLEGSYNHVEYFRDHFVNSLPNLKKFTINGKVLFPK